MKIDETDYPHLSDEILFNRYTGGDTRAFEVLVQRTKGLVYSLILRYVKIGSVADEIFQDVFFKVCKNKKLFREAVSFKAWLATICRNTCIDHTRKLKRTLRTEPIDRGEREDKRNLSEMIPSDEATPDEVAIHRVEDEQMNALLDELPREQRETFYMKVVMELTFEEIGDAMKCSTNTAKSRYRYALEALRGMVKRKRLIDDTKRKQRLSS